MYLTQKIMIEGSNTTRELSQHLQNPRVNHWNAIKYFAGYLKREKGKIKITYRSPREPRYVGMVDANYATNTDDWKSISGAIHTLGGLIVGWNCKTQKATTLSKHRS